MASPLNDAVKLPCGLVLPNRFAKAAMAEMLADWDHNPTPDLIEAYNQWGQGGWGAILTGNVQVDINHLGSPLDLAPPSTYTTADQNPTLVQSWAKYAEACQQHGTPAIVQLCHPGRQSFRGAGKRGLFASTVAPSAVPLRIGEGWFECAVSRVAFPVSREMTRGEVEGVVGQYVDAARLMADAGFSGVELHGAHGYLIDQFLNPKTNLRTDEYGGSVEKRTKFVLDIITETRKVVPANFAIGIKLNSADHSSDNFEDTMTQIKLLTETGIDFLEVSGGSYSDPKMMGYSDQSQLEQPQQPTRTSAREAFFLSFATETRARFPNLILMLTGGFRTRAGAEDAIKQNACDIIGIGRPAAVNPKFPQLLLDESLSNGEAGLPLKKVGLPWYARLIPIKVIGAGAESIYYGGQIKRIGKGLTTSAPA
ncbi:NADH:flavin oxidoreductase/NADH oxidase family protein [Aspergillus glaucus CBS 516.65]|uniref:NADH:flavin oxidoreductase/NADH oxidase N-terminal domain-containing protein n=1 Tax=Aspergillus glaucus CBS 516.65 TaxID=1160497 RepID=A0A1L9VM79_ASPGL|nr:hypothetical protein ASPGLDRAFT_45975 [Aspergillus glaucus CBS 516.65]OJJ85005.1 hypothetical protein ASPGLDRAFT_45975 [Aspergillus glaucus CBS 516.65]